MLFADSLIYGNLITLDPDSPSAKAMAVKDGRIVYVGAMSVMNPDEAISPLRALLAMTANVAYMCRKENELGTFAIGKIANASVYSSDFIHYKNVEDIASATLVATIVDGEEVYKA